MRGARAYCSTDRCPPVFLVCFNAESLSQPTQQSLLLSISISNTLDLPSCHNLSQTLLSANLHFPYMGNQLFLWLDHLQFSDIGSVS